MAYQPSPQYLATIAQLESGGDANAQSPLSSANGMYQFTDPVAAQYGLSDPTDPAAATDAVKSLTSDNYAALSKALGRAPTEPELYLAHQQGATGAAKLLSNPDARAVDIRGKKQILNNGGNANMTAGDFVNKWADKYNKLAGVPDPIAGGTQVADSGQIASDASNFGAGDEVVGQQSFGQGDEAVHPTAQKPTSNAFEPDTSKVRTAVDNFNQGSTMGWGGEITDQLGALFATLQNDPMGALKGQVNDPALAGQIADMRGNNQANLAAGRDAHPVIAGTSQLAGALTNAATIGKLVPSGVAARAATIAKAAPNLTAAAIGGGGSVINSLGEAQGTGAERFDNVGMHDVGGALGGVLGYQLARGVGKAAGALTDRFGQPIKDFISDLKSPPDSVLGGADAVGAGVKPDLSPMKVAGILDEDGLAKMNTSRTLPMTAGQRSQNVNTQRLEEIALKNGSLPMQRALSEQQAAAAKPLQSILGDNQQLDPLSLNGRTQGEMTGAANILRNQYDTLGNKVNAAYDTAAQGANGVAISSGSIKNDFLNNVTNMMADENIRTGDIPKLDSRIGQLKDILSGSENQQETSLGMYGTETQPSQDVDAVKLAQLQQWKKGLNRDIGNTMEPADKRILQGVHKQFEGFMQNVGDDAIVGGDTSAIDAYRKATGLAAQKFNFYDSDKGVQRILDNRDLSGTQLVNTILGANRMTGRGDDGRIVETMLDHAGEQAPQMLNSMRRGVMAKVLNDSLSPTLDPSTVGTGAERNLLDFGKMKKSLGSLMQQRETFNTLFTPTEQSYFKQFHQDVSQIASKQSGAVNNSSTGAYMADMVNGLGKIINNPLLKNVLGVGAVTSMVQGGLEKQAASIVTGKAEAGLGEFLSKAFKQVDAPAVFYGGYMGGRAADPIGNMITGGNNDSNRH